jgi:hypothetical protein
MQVEERVGILEVEIQEVEIHQIVKMFPKECPVAVMAFAVLDMRIQVIAQKIVHNLNYLKHQTLVNLFTGINPINSITNQKASFIEGLLLLD